MEPRLDDSLIREFLACDYGRLVAAFSVLAGSQGLAEEAVQEALTRAWERSRRGEHIESLAAWVAVVARNVLRSGFRRIVAERRARARLGRPLPRPDLDSMSDRVELVAAVRALSPLQREVVALYYFADMPLAEVAVVIGSAEGAVKGALYRARRSLAASLSIPDYEEVDDGVER